jgi:hypothetical protein
MEATPATTHPLTALWWQQRDKCRQCLFHTPMGTVKNNSRGSLGERCSAVTVEDMRAVWLDLYGRRAVGPPDALAFCIDARSAGAPCGPQAMLFKSKPKTQRKG